MRDFAPYSKEEAELSGGAKVVAAIGGFLAFFALLLVLALLGGLLMAVGAHAAGAPVGVAGVAAVGYWMVRARRNRTGRARQRLSWFVLGFTSAMVVFGGCLALLNGL